MNNKNIADLKSGHIASISFFDNEYSAMKAADAISIGGETWDLDGPSPVPWKDFFETLNLSRYKVIQYKCGKKFLEIDAY